MPDINYTSHLKTLYFRFCYTTETFAIKISTEKFSYTDCNFTRYTAETATRQCKQVVRC